ncbi:efflux RND transporter periplasmic adaptor subunit [uncultured Paracoccus sp.]|uniref:efflux RND transporter periplasmic adaptor subunit n=1 Tax=uncultured Paracoccus sp. TaxID=189685 RepID=UPI0026301F0B|nr:efflux RND transporter periplasmic adaptor subunit [uncultured Paracoccus sp.]
MTDRRTRYAAILAAVLSLSVVAAMFVLNGATVANGQAGSSGGRGDSPAAPTSVGVLELSRQAVPVTVTLPGRAVAFQQAAITPEVGGKITEIAYEPGTEVTAGTVLFRLEDETLAAQLSAEEAAVVSTEAAVEGAEATVDRYRRLQGSGVSQAELENAQVALASARAALSGAQARRELAELALRRTEIRSPIDGIVDVPSVSIGDIVSAGPQTTLTTVTQLDPIHVDVAESRARFLRNLARQDAGTLRPGEGPMAQLILETGQVYDQEGYMVSPGLAVSPTTGTVPFRLRFGNPARLILPGQFVRVQLQIGLVDGVLVPQRATSRAADGSLTAFLVRDGKAEEVVLTEAGTHQNAWIVTEGVEAGDQLVLDGLTNLRDGTEVAPVPVMIDAEGVVRDVAESDTDEHGAAEGSGTPGPQSAGAQPAGLAAEAGTTAFLGAPPADGSPSGGPGSADAADALRSVGPPGGQPAPAVRAE